MGAKNILSKNSKVIKNKEIFCVQYSTVFPERYGCCSG